MSEFTLEHLLAIGDMKRKLELYEPVIKAAEALVADWYGWNDGPDNTGLVEAVEALQEARDE